jgi:hypothetical protein
MDTTRIPPAGDPFYAASRRDHHRDHDHPHGCLDGFVYIGHLVEGEDSEETEVFEAVPCRRCSR